MAATGTRPPPTFSPRVDPRAAPAGRRLRGLATGPSILGIAMAAAVVYAAFAHGAISHPENGRLEIGVIVIALATLAGLLYRQSLRFAPSPGAVAGLMLLVGLAAWSALSITWSIAPDDSWVEANRLLAYALVAALGVCLGSSLPRAVEKVALGWVVIALAIALYALAGKVVPWLEIPGIVDFDHTSRFSRLRAPLDYWNALGMICVLAFPIAIRAAADARLDAPWRLAGLVAAVPLLTTLALTLSRGGMLVLLAAVLLLIAVGPDRLRVAAATAIVVAGALPAAALAIASNDLTDEGVKVSERTDDGTFVGLALVLGIVLVLTLGRQLVEAGDRVQLSRRAAASLRRVGLVAAVVVPIVVLAGLSASDRGLRGTIDDKLDSFTEAKLDRQNDPGRVLQTNSGNRWIWWEEAAGAGSDRALVGHGAGSFPLVHLVYRENQIEVQNAHSMPLEQWAETGLVGVALALGALAVLGFAAVRATVARAPGPERGLAVAMLAALFAWWLHLWVDWDWEIPGVALPVLVMLGVLAAVPRAAGRHPPASPVPGRGLAFAIGGAAAVAAIVSVALPMLSRDLTSEALTQASSNTAGDLRAAAEKAGRAKRLNPLSPEPLFAQASIYERGNQPAAAARALAEAVERQPNDPGVWLRLVRFQLLLDDSAGARRSLLAISGLNPLAAFTILNFESLLYDERRSASATGTPLPEKLPGDEPAPKPKKQPRKKARPRARRPARSSPAPSNPAPANPSPSPSPAPSPAPQRPSPAPQPSPQPAPGGGGDPFRLEG